MKNLGQGWQYTVYDLKNGRVVKKRNSKLKAYFLMAISCFPYKKYPHKAFPEYYKTGTIQAKDSLKKILNSSLDKGFFGNPKVSEDGIQYEQDKAEPLSKYFKRVDRNESKRVIDLFFDFNKILLEYKLIDKSFAIGRNFGLNERGEVILTDLGEIFSTPEMIDKQLKKKAWMAPYVLKCLPSNELRKYFIQKMDNLVTTD